MGTPNPDAAQSVWVYHDGKEEGPFTAEAFNQRLNAGQWPPNAIVGLDDRTEWSGSPTRSLISENSNSRRFERAFELGSSLGAAID
jgi:hypothetical protein